MDVLQLRMDAQGEHADARAVGGVAIAGGVGSLINHSFSSIIIGIYEGIAGALIIFLEVRPPTEEHKALIQRYASFMHSFIGRGVCELQDENRPCRGD